MNFPCASPPRRHRILTHLNRSKVSDRADWGMEGNAFGAFRLAKNDIIIIKPTSSQQLNNLVQVTDGRLTVSLEVFEHDLCGCSKAVNRYSINPSEGTKARRAGTLSLFKALHSFRCWSWSWSWKTFWKVLFGCCCCSQRKRCFF